MTPLVTALVASPAPRTGPRATLDDDDEVDRPRVTLAAIGRLGSSALAAHRAASEFFGSGGSDALEPGSNFGAMVKFLESGGSPGSCHALEVDEGRLLLATRLRVMRRALADLDTRDVETLALAFSPPEGEIRGLGRLSALVLKTEAAAFAHRLSRSTRPLADWLLRLAHRGETDADARACLNHLRVAAEDERDDALRALTKAMRGAVAVEHLRLAAARRRANEDHGRAFDDEDT